MKGYILLAEDERPIADVVAEILTEEGYQVKIVHDGASVLLSVRCALPDLLILDIGMPVMTGDEVLKELRAAGFTALPIVIASAGLHADRLLGCGATELMAKPYDIERLLHTVEKYV